MNWNVYLMDETVEIVMKVSNLSLKFDTFITIKTTHTLFHLYNSWTKDTLVKKKNESKCFDNVRNNWETVDIVMKASNLSLKFDALCTIKTTYTLFQLYNSWTNDPVIKKNSLKCFDNVRNKTTHTLFHLYDSWTNDTLVKKKNESKCFDNVRNNWETVEIMMKA